MNKRRKDLIFRIPKETSPFAKRQHVFLGPLLYNKVNQAGNIYSKPRYNCKEIVTKFLQLKSYSETSSDSLLQIIYALRQFLRYIRLGQTDICPSKCHPDGTHNSWPVIARSEAYKSTDENKEKKSAERRRIEERIVKARLCDTFLNSSSPCWDSATWASSASSRGNLGAYDTADCQRVRLAKVPAGFQIGHQHWV
ncbi:unnamed protein product [Parnassius apollo]|uniref:(apollo) hypothetical protein n=1 Tax=Parnassius apollo TaxID=110799 RepID=A0A8S3Y635_PARAO|nr:unnamed protein product [Parnassius apollo]